MKRQQRKYTRVEIENEDENKKDSDRPSKDEILAKLNLGDTDHHGANKIGSKS